MILINPPVVKPSEPPPGIAKLSGALTACNIAHTIIDANMEGLRFLLGKGGVPRGTWTARAMKKLPRNLKALKNPHTYTNMDRYRQAVMDINRLLCEFAGDKDVSVSLTDYRHRRLSPVKSGDLLYIAEHPELSPFFPYFQDRLEMSVNDNAPRFIGFSVNFLSQAITAFAMMGFVKKRFPTVGIIAGGGLITSWMTNPRWRNPFGGLADHLVAGPGEGPLLSILGITGQEGSHFTPRYDSFTDGEYLSPGFILPYGASTGCYWGKCAFCPETAQGSRYCQINNDAVTEDLRVLSEKTRPVMIHLVDNAISPALLRKISGEPPGPPWYGFARITDHLADYDFCRALKRSGCAMLKMGLESGSQEVIDYLSKGIDLETASRALKNLKVAGIAAYCYLLFGTPAETEETARKTLQFVAACAPYMDFINIAVFNMPINSPDAALLGTKRFYEGDLSLYTDFTHPGGWGRLAVRRFIEGEFKRHPAISPIIRRNPPFFTSNHAPLLAY